MLLSNSQVHVLHLSIIPKLSNSSHGVIVATLFILFYDIGAGDAGDQVNNKENRNWGTVSWLKCLLSKGEDLSSGAKNPRQADIAMHICNLSVPMTR